MKTTKNDPGTLSEGAGFYFKLEDFGFKSPSVLQRRDEGEMIWAGWSKLGLIMEKQGKIPERKLVVSEHPVYGVNIALFSLPWDEIYHFNTGSPVNQKEALRLVEEYLQTTGEGRKYRGG